MAGKNSKAGRSLLGGLAILALAGGGVMWAMHGSATSKALAGTAATDTQIVAKAPNAAAPAAPVAATSTKNKIIEAVGGKSDKASGGIQTIDFDLLDKADVEPTKEPAYPDEIKKLAGKKVKIQGFMVPYTDMDNMKVCLVMPYQVSCFFCEMPSLTQVALVRQSTDGDCPMIMDPIEVEGTLRLFEKRDDDPDLASFVYTIDNAKVTAIQDYTPPPPAALKAAATQVKSSQ